MTGSRFRSRDLAAAPVAVAVLLLALATMPGVLAGEVAVERIAGPDRISTAVAAAHVSHPDGADHVLLARADDYPDAVAGATLAGALDAPLLLTAADAVGATLQAALEGLGTSRVTLLGGAAAIGDEVADRLAETVDVTRVFGDDRFGTAAAIARRAAEVTPVGTVDGVATALLVTGEAFPDALAAGQAAASAGLPILLTAAGGLPEATTMALTDLGIGHVVVVGGVAAVGAAVEAELTALGVTVERVAGPDRTATAAALATWAVEALDLSPATVVLARADEFADALPAASLAAATRSPVLLLQRPQTAGTAAVGWLRDRCEEVERLRVLGGPAAVTAATAATVADAAGCAGPSPGPTATAPPTPTPTPTAPPGGDFPAPGEVGFLGDEGDLQVIDGPGDAPPGTEWAGDHLAVTGTDVVLDGVLVRGGVELQTIGTLTIRDSVVEGGHGTSFVVLCRAAGATLDISDSTLRWREGAQIDVGIGNGAIQAANVRVLATRNDISGTADGIQFAGDGSRITSNWIHDLALVGDYPDNTHNDGIQMFDGADVVIARNRIEIGFDGVHQNGAIFLQPGDGNDIPGIRITGNYLQGGGFTLRLEKPSTSGAVVTDTTFGPLDPGAFGYVSVTEGATIAEWSGNVTVDGTPVGPPGGG